MGDVVLVGSFGPGNPGDAALREAFRSELRAHSLTVHNVHPSAPTERSARRAASAHRGAGATPPADTIVLCGGTIFQRPQPGAGHPASQLHSTARLLARARLRRVPVAAVGVGAAGLHGHIARSLCRWIIPRLDLLVLRDEESAAMLDQAGAPPPFWVGADPSWVVLRAPSTKDRFVGDRRTITVVVSHRDIDAVTVERLAEALARVPGEWTIRLQPWRSDPVGPDQRLAEQLRDRLGGAEILDPPGDLTAAAAAFAGDDLVIGTCMHALVAGACAGTRLLGLSRRPETGALARRLEQPSVPAHATAAVLAATIAYALANEPPTVAAVEPTI